MGMSEMLEIIQGEQRYLQRKIARHAQTVVGDMQPSTVRLLPAQPPAHAETQPDVGTVQCCSSMLRMELRSRWLLSCSSCGTHQHDTITARCCSGATRTGPPWGHSVRWLLSPPCAEHRSTPSGGSLPRVQSGCLSRAWSPGRAAKALTRVCGGYRGFIVWVEGGSAGWDMCISSIPSGLLCCKFFARRVIIRRTCVDSTFMLQSCSVVRRAGRCCHARPVQGAPLLICLDICDPICNERDSMRSLQP